MLLNVNAWYSRSLIGWNKHSRSDLIEGYRAPKSLCQLVRSLVFLYFGVFTGLFLVGFWVVMPTIFTIVCFITDPATWWTINLQEHTKLFSSEGFVSLGAIDIGASIGLGIIFGLFWLREQYREWAYQRRIVARKRRWAELEAHYEGRDPLPKEPNIIAEWLRSIHNKVCPSIDFVEKD